MFIVYCHTNIKTNMSYIGYTKTTSMKAWKYRHLTNAFKYNKHFDLSYALREHGSSDDVWHHNDLEFHENLKDAQESEEFFIAYLSTHKPNGYNMTKGGEGTTGVKHSKQIRANMAASHRGKKLTTQHRANISKSTKGKPSNTKGKKLSIQTRLKMSKSRKGKPSPTKGKIPWNKGKKANPIAIAKIASKLKGRTPWNKGKILKRGYKRPPEVIEKMKLAWIKRKARKLTNTLPPTEKIEIIDILPDKTK